MAIAHLYKRCPDCINLMQDRIGSCDACLAKKRIALNALNGKSTEIADILRNVAFKAVPGDDSELIAEWTQNFTKHILNLVERNQLVLPTPQYALTDAERTELYARHIGMHMSALNLHTYWQRTPLWSQVIRAVSEHFVRTTKPVPTPTKNPFKEIELNKALDHKYGPMQLTDALEQFAYRLRLDSTFHDPFYRYKRVIAIAVTQIIYSEDVTTLHIFADDSLKNPNPLFEPDVARCLRDNRLLNVVHVDHRNYLTRIITALVFIHRLYDLKNIQAPWHRLMPGYERSALIVDLVKHRIIPIKPSGLNTYHERKTHYLGRLRTKLLNFVLYEHLPKAEKEELTLAASCRLADWEEAQQRGY